MPVYVALGLAYVARTLGHRKGFFRGFNAAFNEGFTAGWGDALEAVARRAAEARAQTTTDEFDAVPNQRWRWQ